MAELMDDVTYLSQEVGPRPAGTEEEQQAALYIADKVHQRTGFHAEIEDINCMANSDLVDVIYLAVAFVCLLVAFIFPVTSIVTFVLGLVCAILYAIEVIAKRPILARLLTRDISQNVVVKYKPGMESQRMGTPRKIVVVTNYDSGRVQQEARPRMTSVYAFIMKAAAVSVIASPILILLRNIVLAGSLGVVSAILSLLCVLALLFMVLPMVFIALRRFSAFNEGANNNAASVAVMLEVLRRIDGTAAPENAPHARATRRDDEPAEEPVVHGERAARAAGVVPEGVELSYADDVVETAPAEAPANAPAVPYANDFAEGPEEADEAPAAPAVEPEDDSAAGRLRSAKAAIAALTGEAVNEDIFLDFGEEGAKPAPAPAPVVEAAPAVAEATEAVAETAVEAAATAAEAVAEEAVAAVQEPVAEAATAAAAVAGVAAYAATRQQPSEPAWYTAARAKANRPVDIPAKRSQYADALDAAVKESSTHFQQANSLVDEETEARLRQMRESFAPPAPEPAPEPEPQPAPEPEPMPEPEPVVAPEPAPAPSSTAAFPPVGTQGEVVAFEPEDEFDMGDDEFEEPAAVAEPQPEPEPEPVAVEEAAPEQPVEPVEPAEEPAEEPADDYVIDLDDDDIEILDAELVEIIGDGEYAEDEYADYADFDEPAAAEQPVAQDEVFDEEYEEEYEEEEPEDVSIGARVGGFFSRIREAIIPPANEEEDGVDFEGYSDGSDDSDEQAAAEAAPTSEAEGEGEDEAYDDEPSRFADLRDRMSGAFSRFTNKIAPTPDYEEQDYTYEEDAYQPIEEAPSADTPFEETTYEEPVFVEDEDEVAPVVEAAEPEGGLESVIIDEPLPMPEYENDFTGFDVVLPEDSIEPVVAPVPVVPGQREQTMFIEELEDFDEPVGFEEPEPEPEPAPVVPVTDDEDDDLDATTQFAFVPAPEFDEAPEPVAEPEPEPAAELEQVAEPEPELVVEPVAEPELEIEEEPGFEPEPAPMPEPEPQPEPVYEPVQEQPTEEYSYEQEAVQDEPVYEDEAFEDEWEDEPEREGFMSRISGFWNRLFGRDEDDEFVEEDADYDFGANEVDESSAEEPQVAAAPAAAAAAAAALTYQTAYAPKRMGITSVNASYDTATLEREYEAVPEPEPEPEPEPMPEPEPEPVVVPEPEPVVAAEPEPEPVLIEEDPSNQQVVAMPDEAGEYEAPVAVKPAEPEAAPARPANPRAARAGRFESTVA
ncbi:MAG: hypothetical protein Q4D27_01040, partial [Coriobacteriia bacterium]|nr:hypothetical protein [Coriobacteriia bacterium]